PRGFGNGARRARTCRRWMAQRTQAEVLEVFARHEATLAPVYDVAQIFEDPHYRARGAIVTVEDEELGPTRVCNVFPRLSRTPGQVRHLGPGSPGARTEETPQALGYSEEQVQQLRARGVV